MKISECYEMLNGDYEQAKMRLMKDALVEKFMLKYLDDSTFESLKAAVAAGSIEESFRAAHTLKGVAANLSFTQLCETASELTEQLRPGDASPDEKLVSAVERAHNNAVVALSAYKAQM